MELAARRVGKEQDVLDGALAVFAADGYARASIDNIARAAGVSSRTIYNRFGDKAGLFQAVVVDSAHRVAESEIATIGKHLGRVRDIDHDLAAFGRVWATPDPAVATHFALVRQIRAEVGHVPEAAIEAWQQAGPLRVRRVLAEHLRRLATDGHLLVPDADIAAAHLVQLVAGDITNRTFHGVRPLPTREVNRLADAGTAAFLRAYRATPK